MGFAPLYPSYGQLRRQSDAWNLLGQIMARANIFQQSVEIGAGLEALVDACRIEEYAYHSIIWSRRLVFIVTWWSEGLMMVVEVVVMALSFSPQSVRVIAAQRGYEAGGDGGSFAGSIEPDIADLGGHRVAMSPKHPRIPPALPRLAGS
ncbi:hypothetical protein AAFG13_41610 [Bradyrhizobium sp. B124]|uniref:hypothetical protein n=1 Tax=Bradyrhizobium sp. B124 TaxID=3140245 RepID=UPI003182F56E